jgi:hypothetical protein
MMSKGRFVAIIDGFLGESSGQFADDRFPQATDESSSTLLNDAVRAWPHV